MSELLINVTDHLILESMGQKQGHLFPITNHFSHFSFLICSKTSQKVPLVE